MDFRGAHEFPKGLLGLLSHATSGPCAVPGQSREVTDCSIRVRNLSFYHLECFAAATTTNPATPGMFIRPTLTAFEKASPHACIPQAAEISSCKKNPTPQVFRRPKCCSSSLTCTIGRMYGRRGRPSILSAEAGLESPFSQDYTRRVLPFVTIHSVDS